MQDNRETMGAEGPRRNPTHTGPPPAAPAPSWWRSAAIVLVFALTGPAFGAIGAVLLLTLLAVQGGGAADAGGSIGEFVLGGFAVTLIFALPVAYSFGLPAALLVGLAVARADRRRPGISWRTALGVAAIAGVAMAGLATLVVPAQGLAVWSATLLVATLVAALAGWAIAGHLFGRR